MSPRRSAGLLLHRGPLDALEMLIGHLGGPLWARRDERAWSIPKGEHGDDEHPLAAARREFAEELGVPVPAGEPVDLGEVRQSGGKIVRVWALAGDLDAAAVRSNTFTLEWPPRSGRMQQFPELDRAMWADPPTARAKLVAAQAAFVDRLVEHLAHG